MKKKFPIQAHQLVKTWLPNVMRDAQHRYKRDVMRSKTLLLKAPVKDIIQAKMEASDRNEWFAFEVKQDIFILFYFLF